MSSQFFNKLQLATEPQRNQLYHNPRLLAALSGDISKTEYISYLTEAYHHVSHTVRFLMTMGSCLSPKQQFLLNDISKYIEEEVGHEEWILSDIEASGGNKIQARNSTPNLETQVFIAYIYDYIKRKNPIGLFGMVYMLESTSIAIADKGADALKTKLQLPKKAFSYLYSHGKLDHEHLRIFQNVLEKITNMEDQQAIIEVAQNCFILFGNILNSIKKDPSSEKVADYAA